MSGNSPENEWDRVTQRKGQYTRKCPVAKILQLSPDGGVFRALVIADQRQRAQQVHRDKEAEHQAVKRPPHLNQRCAEPDNTRRNRGQKDENTECRQVKSQPSQPAGKPFRLCREN